MAQISAEPWGAERQEEVVEDIVVHAVLPLPMGMKREERCE